MHGLGRTVCACERDSNNVLSYAPWAQGLPTRPLALPSWVKGLTLDYLSKWIRLLLKGFTMWIRLILPKKKKKKERKKGKKNSTIFGFLLIEISSYFSVSF